VRIFFVPSYLNGQDGVFNKTYYELLAGLDITLFPSYYEPWGYTPLESLAFSVPTVTTTLAGFGLWVKEHLAGEHPGIVVVERDDNNYLQVAEKLSEIIEKAASLSGEEERELRKSAKLASRIALWENQLIYYKRAYSMAIDNIADNRGAFPQSPDDRDHLNFKINVANKPNWSTVIINKQLPQRLEHLDTISKNLWWSWNDEAMELFKMVDPLLWKESHGNPILLLDSISLKRTRELEKDSVFLAKLDKVYSDFVKLYGGGQSQ
jgi:glycogen phosphorylase/synthase